MGLLKLLGHTVAWPVTGPAFLTRYSIETVRDSAVKELTDESSLRQELLELQLRLEEGRIDEETYVEEEADLMWRIRETRRWRERLGMSVQGGPVSMGREGDRVEVDLEIGFD
jgi:hypothetical protein